ncbi:hypothetical protein DM01DRAFT_1339404 [Hesseltinella vesiculosa]|uniref:Arrestin C-terminal-like domain-containing protein n=1 Tax=Hesseltinella vesiculosa TaxID=101127 RepID=A0A1X2G706_9FUNG|nr:hypothetical protein DM01DRAFT_1339404 [Hesseltinella vesiculosa]
MLSLSKSKGIDIQLDSEKFYFPGDAIQGFIHVHPKSATKTNCIRIKFQGELVLEKDTVALFQLSKTVDLEDQDPQLSYVVLEPKAHSFPFQWRVPDDIQIPSTMVFNKKIKVRYTISAIHDKHRIPESLCPQASYPVQILDMINVEDPKYRSPFDKTYPIMVRSSNGTPCMVRVTLPRSGYTRGDVISVSTVVNHIQPFGLSDAFQVQLIRTVHVRQSKSSVQKKQDILKSVSSDLNINDNMHLSQTLNQQLMIPSSTPPSLALGDELLDIQYKLRLHLQLQHTSILVNKMHDQKEEGTLTIDIPITIGTWPRADVPIDDEDEEDDEYPAPPPLDEHSVEDWQDSDNRYPSPRDERHSSSGSIRDGNDALSTMDKLRRPLDPVPLSPSTQSSASTIRLTPKSSLNRSSSGNHPLTADVGRSDSMASRSSSHSCQSFSSWHSNQSWGDSPSPSLSRNTSMSTDVSNNDAWKRQNMPLSPTVSTMSGTSNITDNTILLTPASERPTMLRAREGSNSSLLQPIDSPTSPLQKRRSLTNSPSMSFANSAQRLSPSNSILLQPSSLPSTPRPEPLSLPRSPIMQTPPVRRPPPQPSQNLAESSDDDDDDDDDDILTVLRRAEKQPALTTAT